MRNAVVSRIGKYITAWLAALVITAAALTPALPAKAASNEEIAFFYLTDTLGFNVAAACGIMANIRHESRWAAVWTVLSITAGITDLIPNRCRVSSRTSRTN